MELRQLEHFLAVIEAGSLAAAAHRSGVTQQALSKSLSRLEATLGGKLFERQARGMALTRFGATTAEYARDVVASANRLQAAAAAELGLERGKLVVGLSPIAATTDIGRRVASFAERHPALRIDVIPGIEREFSLALQRGEIDLALAAQMEGHEENILVEQVASEPWGIAGRKSNAQLKNAKTLKDLDGARWLIGRNTDLLNEAITGAFDAAGAAHPQPGVMTTSVLFTLTMLAHTDYLAIFPRSLCESTPSLRWRDLGGGAWTSPIYIMRRRQAHLNMGARQLLTELTSQ